MATGLWFELDKGIAMQFLRSVNTRYAHDGRTLVLQAEVSINFPRGFYLVHGVEMYAGRAAVEQRLT